MSQQRNGAGQEDRWLQQVRQHQEDHAWALRQSDILDRHAGKVILMHRREVLGVGGDYQEAVADAETAASSASRAIPPRDEWLFVFVPEASQLDVVADALARRAEIEAPAKTE